ncbi:SDR family oxidoreductase [Agromyces neolithicus]|uniref:NAD(P)H-binding protein n=1 Tax=Agromyces neolithicus TaxID=269420 RepID=A0ABP4Y1K9_9MICO
MTALLVTGGSGKLGLPTVARLRTDGHDVRVLSRREGEGHAVGDLRTGVGIRQAVDGIDTVLHLATRNGRGDVALTRTLLEACRSAGVRHVIYMSIVGVDRISLGYYREKLAIEQLLASSGVPHTILRATQFHDLVARLFSMQRHLPVVFAPSFSFQPIATEDVATRLAELAVAEAAGRVPDIGGPEQLPAVDLARQWERAASVQRRIVPVSLPGRVFAGYSAGYNLVPGPASASQTFADFLAERHGTRA